jgi:DNA-binding winged helix-turn-helix (wHTH) protein
MPSDSHRQVFRFGDFELNLRTGELRHQGSSAPLQNQPARILALLLEHSGEVVTREEFRESIWPEGTFVDFELALNTAIRKLRRALNDDAASPKLIETIPRIGYRFIGTVTSNGSHHSPIDTDASPQVFGHNEVANNSSVARPFIVRNWTALLATMVVLIAGIALLL